MSWFKRSEKGIQTKTEEKKDIPKGLWYKTPTGKIVETQELASNFYVVSRGRLSRSHREQGIF